MNTSIIQKYNIPGPRYTSYPTVPFWSKQGIDYADWTNTVQRSFIDSNDEKGISIYIHLPFCESLCTFCACHKRITKQHSVESPYIDTLLKEWQLYLNLFSDKPKIQELHLGGGTPTFFSPQNIERLINGILQHATLNDEAELSFEAHPNNTSREHLQILYNLGFRRTSFGIQDYDPVVQKAINRMQSFEQVEKVTHWTKEIGYTSISQDLIFGLPHQTLDSIQNTIALTKKLHPDRIAFYSYAHVPWLKGNGQRGFNEDDLPSPLLKRELYESGKELLADLGYHEIGMDHFALPTDSLYQSMQNKTLHRNFMGYTTNNTKLMIGLGMSSISDSWYGFAQNFKSLKEYTEVVDLGMIPIFRGHKINDEDLIIRQHILNLMCQFETNWKSEEMKFSRLNECLDRLHEMRKDGLVILTENTLSLTEEAKPFVRNVCMAFDTHLIDKSPKKKIFSMTI